MNLLQFIASVAHSLAWPAAVVLLGLIFQRPLKALIPQLRRARWKDLLELDFGREVQDLEQKVSELKPATTPSLPSTASVPLALADGASAMLEEAEALSDGYPEPAVLIAWKAVETELRQAAERQQLGSEHASRRGPLGVVQELSRDELISSGTVQFLDQMRRLRNAVAHSHGARISTDDARRFIALARDVVYTLRNVPGKTPNGEKRAT